MALTDQFATTTYMRSFDPYKLDDIKTWKTKFGNTQPHGEAQIQWAGGVHSREHFNKKKDFIMDWTNVLFRN